MHHYWNAPNVAGIPGPTSVVIRTDCGQTMTIPAWRVTEWQTANIAKPPADQTCPACLKAQS
jgi:hypothetical protein